MWSPALIWTGTLIALCVLLAAPAAAVKAFNSELQPCPDTCVGQADQWTVFSSIERLSVCEQPVLLDFAIHNPVDDPSTHVKLRTCTPGNAKGRRDALDPSPSTTARDAACIASKSEKVMTMDVSTSGQEGHVYSQDVDTALEKVASYLSSSCETEFIAGYSKGAVIGVYSGVLIDNQATAASILHRLTTQVAKSKTTLVQLCGQGRNADQTFGVAIDTSGDIAAVQKAIVAWSNATCVDGLQTTGHLENVSIFEAAPPFNADDKFGSTPLSFRRLFARADCTTQYVVSGDSCGSLATKCHISPSDFTKYNSKPNLCASLTPGQQVCCSPGQLPDITPKPNSDGSCSTYHVESGDTCSSIAAKNGLTVEDVSGFNDKTTWGWFGCKDLMAGLAVCLSKGKPPLPASVPNAVCGPIKPGSKASSSVAVADMNPCPLNSCCNIWGQCGITPQYCTKESGPTGNPGTAPTGHNGCISNCGTDIANHGSKPSHFKSVGYYESWNWDRPCLNMRAASIDPTAYTHAHWAFATITSSFDVKINDTQKQWDGFTGLYGINRIVSLGGWGYSTDPSTYNTLRHAMDPSNAGAFADNIVKFINANQLDGVDFDWEYPGAPDIPGIPPGLKSDGPNYLSFLKTLRAKMPKGKTISIAAPASYWYLQAFPIAEMSKQLDYIVYMAYDLHGQWDYGNKWSQDGCPSGSCLRSHVNLTETNYALAMITKAGVPANLITVGISSYGRSFGMTQPGCKGPMCTFGGPASTATPGDCTATAGYISNAELYQILGANETANAPSTWYDTDSNSDIMIYNKTQWVAFMSPATKTSRTGYYQGLNFGGTVDWAVDLQEFTDDEHDPNAEDEDLPLPAPDIPLCTADFATLEDLDGSAGGIPNNCKGYYLAQTLNNVLKDAMKNYTDMMNDGYDGKFTTYANAVSDAAGDTVHDFVTQNGNKYFSCIVAETATCCDYCKANSHSDSYCDYCFSGTCSQDCGDLGCNNKRDLFGSYTDVERFSPLSGRDRPQPVQQIITKVVNITEPCPPDYSKRGQGPDNPYEQSVYWTMKSDKSNDFFADLLTNTGIPKNKIEFSTYDRGLDCAPSAQPGDPCYAEGMDFNIPVPNGYTSSDVTNPKDVIKKALSNSNDLSKQIADAALSLKLNCYDGDSYELVDAISLPILMIAEAVDSMSQVESAADKIDEEKRKAIILAFLGAILFFIPIAGEVLGAVTELGDLASVITILGAVGNTAMDVYTIVDDPNNAFLAIFSLILEPLALANVGKIAKAANIRRGMNDADIAKLGGKIAARLKTIKKVTGVCHKM